MRLNFVQTTITTNPIEVLKKTFVEQPQAVAGMPELYVSPLDAVLESRTDSLQLQVSSSKLQ